MGMGLRDFGRESGAKRGGFWGFSAEFRDLGGKSDVERPVRRAVFAATRPAHYSKSGASFARTSSTMAAGALFQPAPVAGAEIEGAGLIAADHPGGFRPRFRERHGEAGRPREVSAGGDRQHHRRFCQPVEHRRQPPKPGACLAAHARRWDRAKPGKCRRAPLEELMAHRLGPEPVPVFGGGFGRSVAWARSSSRV